VSVRQRIQVVLIIEEWRRVTGIDVTGEFGGISKVVVLLCGGCGLYFYEPAVIGSASLYSRLETIDWYCDKEK
jgi:hypothetical protein